jgi:hypothetical protein
MYNLARKLMAAPPTAVTVEPRHPIWLNQVAYLPRMADEAYHQMMAKIQSNVEG